MSDLLLMSPPGLPRNGLIALYDPYRDAYGLDAAGRAALQTGVDYSGNGNTLTYGATTGASTDDPVNTGTAWSFDGGDYLKVGMPLTGGQDFSVLIVAQTPTLTSSEQTLFSVNNYDNGIQIYEFLGVTPQTLGVRVGGVSASVTGMTGLTSPHCVLVAQRSGVITTYLHGSLVKTANVGTAWVNAFGTCLGVRAQDKVRFLTGSIFIAAIWGRGLSSQEAAKSYLYSKSLMARRGVTLA